MLAVDGAQHSGSGTIVRYTVALAALLGRPVRVFNARKRRRSPGLRPQHVTSVRACAAMCGATTEGLEVDSTEFMFVPGSRILGGTYNWDIGTAGSTTMLALSVLPLACFADSTVRVRIEGGVFQDFAPSPYHLEHVCRRSYCGWERSFTCGDAPRLCAARRWNHRADGYASARTASIADPH
jgi:RNA 3'-terminal phosphate cyclase (ATP)